MVGNVAALVFYLANLVAFVCFVIVLVQMFQHGEGGLAFVCIALSICCGLGSIIAFIIGWSRAKHWNISNLMTTWTVAAAIIFVSGGTVYVSVPNAPFRFH
jgi:hypothetical protein